MLAVILSLLMSLNIAAAMEELEKEESYLTIDVGRTQIKSALFVEGSIIKEYCEPTTSALTQTQLRSFLSNSFDPFYYLHGIAVSSVISEINLSFIAVCKELNFPIPTFLNDISFSHFPFRISTTSPFDADRIAACLGAYTKFPNQDLIIIDSDIVTTFTILDNLHNIHRGPIMPDFNRGVETLHKNTSSLPFATQINTSPKAVLNTTYESIQSGIVLLMQGGCDLAIKKICTELGFQKPLTISCGSNGPLLHQLAISNWNEPSLKFLGLYYFLKKSETDSSSDEEAYYSSISEEESGYFADNEGNF